MKTSCAHKWEQYTRTHGGGGGISKTLTSSLKFSPVNKIHIFQHTGMIFHVEFQRYHLKFHTISYPYFERYDFNTTSNFKELLDLRAHASFWNAPLITTRLIQNYWKKVSYFAVIVGNLECFVFKKILALFCPLESHGVKKSLHPFQVNMHHIAAIDCKNMEMTRGQETTQTVKGQVSNELSQ